MRMKDLDITDTNRTRLKTTLTVIVIVAVLTIFPMHVILKATKSNVYELNAAWTAWTACVTGIVGVAGFYINRESLRPSIIGVGIGMIRGRAPIQKFLKDQEDETDPDNIPL